MAQAQDYKTLCYKRQGNHLLFPENCTVNLNFNSPENGLEWRIVTHSGQVQHYRNQGHGIERWSHQRKKWEVVVNTNWFPGEDNILCWDNFCANWTNIPMD